jgi:hypothetical protein
MKKFEYKIHRTIYTDHVNEINEIGLGGWELVNVIEVTKYPPTSTYILHFKREIL